MCPKENFWFPFSPVPCTLWAAPYLFLFSLSQLIKWEHCSDPPIHRPTCIYSTLKTIRTLTTSHKSTPNTLVLVFISHVNKQEATADIFGPPSPLPYRPTVPHMAARVMVFKRMSDHDIPVTKSIQSLPISLRLHSKFLVFLTIKST